ncbi:MAG: hypothetical protein Q9216_005762 [Gyalolechia sp. 2 TL-2023]
MYGLSELYDPPDALVDIVLVHGLHGSETRIWTYSSGQNSVVWPQELLPSDTGEARILTFEYDANIAHFWARPSENRLDSYSDDLFQQLDNNRHRIGAGVVDAVNGSESIRRLASCIRRIAFLGTPHQGSDKAQWAETGRRFIRIFKTTNAELSKDLDEKSEKLAKLGVQFPALLNSRAQDPEPRIDVVCFYEGQTTRLGVIDVGMIVKESSACLAGYPRTLLDANHENMCKFNDRNDINYVRLSGLLARWVKELKNTQGTSEKQTATHASFSGSHNAGFQLGHNSGNISGFTFGRK